MASEIYSAKVDVVPIPAGTDDFSNTVFHRKNNITIYQAKKSYRIRGFSSRTELKLSVRPFLNETSDFLMNLTFHIRDIKRTKPQIHGFKCCKMSLKGFKCFFKVMNKK